MDHKFSEFYAKFFRGEWTYHGMGDAVMFTSQGGLCGEFGFSGHPASELDGPAHTYLRTTLWLGPGATPHPDRTGELYRGQYRPWAWDRWRDGDEVLATLEDYWSSLGQDALSTAVAGNAWMAMVSAVLRSFQPYFLEGREGYQSYPFLKKQIELLNRANGVDMGSLVGLDFGRHHG